MCRVFTQPILYVISLNAELLTQLYNECLAACYCLLIMRGPHLTNMQILQNFSCKSVNKCKLHSDPDEGTQNYKKIRHICWFKLSRISNIGQICRRNFVANILDIDRINIDYLVKVPSCALWAWQNGSVLWYKFSTNYISQN